ncbi:hypothetical protein HXZ66_00545 [Bacillus sp. A116_S68]|nr:hypothetical protein HXZ66_00545 [Bacillus sp. A116_S68]
MVYYYSSLQAKATNLQKHFLKKLLTVKAKDVILIESPKTAIVKIER